LKTATVDEKGWRNVEESGGSVEAKHISFLNFKDLASEVNFNYS